MEILAYAACAAAALAILYVIASAVCGLVIANMVTLPKRVSAEEIRTRDSDRGCPECFGEYDNEWDRHDFTIDTEGAVISGEYIFNPDDSGSRRKVAIICHGHTVSRQASLKYGRVFYRAGYSLVIYDERYFGSSTAKYCTLGMNESHDLKAVIAFTRQIFGADCFLCLHGESMGAASALLALDTEAPDYVVADCPFADTVTLMRCLTRAKCHILTPLVVRFTRSICIHRCKYDMCQVSPIKSVRQSNVPICFIHGRDDDYILCSHSQALYEASRNPDNELHIVPGAVHARSITADPVEYENIIRAFAEKIEGKAY